MNFGDISEKFSFFELSLDFKFSDDSISSFSHVLSTFPVQQKESEMPLITFQKTIDNISVDNLVTLLSLSANRICINLEGVDIKSIFKRSKYSLLLEMEDPNDPGYLNEKKFFVKILMKKNYQLISFLLKGNPNLMKIEFN